MSMSFGVDACLAVNRRGTTRHAVRKANDGEARKLDLRKMSRENFRDGRTRCRQPETGEWSLIIDDDDDDDDDNDNDNDDDENVGG